MGGRVVDGEVGVGGGAGEACLLRPAVSPGLGEPSSVRRGAGKLRVPEGRAASFDE